jgi:excisionase family DNA binding protein
MKTEHGSAPSSPCGGLLTARQAAQFLAIGLRTLWSLTNAREIPHLRIKRSVRYDPADLTRWIEKQKEKPREG